MHAEKRRYFRRGYVHVRPVEKLDKLAATATAYGGKLGWKLGLLFIANSFEEISKQAKTQAFGNKPQKPAQAQQQQQYNSNNSGYNNNYNNNRGQDSFFSSGSQNSYNDQYNSGGQFGGGPPF